MSQQLSQIQIALVRFQNSLNDTPLVRSQSSRLQEDLVFLVNAYESELGRLETNIQGMTSTIKELQTIIKKLSPPSDEVDKKR